MKLWMIFIPMFAVGGLNVAYDAWKASPTSKTEQVRRQCIGMSKEKGIPAHVAVDTCNCMVYEAKDWIGDHSVEEYTRDVHMKIGLQCYAKATEKAKASASSFGTFTSGPVRPRNTPAAGSGWAGAPPAQPASPFAPTPEYGDPDYVQ